MSASAFGLRIRSAADQTAAELRTIMAEESPDVLAPVLNTILQAAAYERPESYGVALRRITRGMSDEDAALVLGLATYAIQEVLARALEHGEPWAVELCEESE